MLTLFFVIKSFIILYYCLISRICFCRLMYSRMHCNTYITINNPCILINFLLQCNSQECVTDNHTHYCAMNEFYFVKFSKKIIICIPRIYFKLKGLKGCFRLPSRHFNHTTRENYNKVILATWRKCLGSHLCQVLQQVFSGMRCCSFCLRKK